MCKQVTNAANNDRLQTITNKSLRKKQIPNKEPVCLNKGLIVDLLLPAACPIVEVFIATVTVNCEGRLHVQ